MLNNSISCNVTVEGEIFHCPAKLLIGSQNNKMIFCGVIQWGGRPISDVLKETDETITSKVGSYVSGLLPECLPGELSLLHQDDITVIGLRESNIYFKLAMATDNTALLFAFQAKSGGGVNADSSALLGALGRAADFFGAKEFIFYAQTGERWLLPMLKPNSAADVAGIPTELSASKFLIYTHIVMDGDSIFVSAVKTLFGLKETELYFGTKDKGFVCMLAIPAFQNSFMRSENLYLMVQVDGALSFVLKGEFVFPFLSKMCFSVECGIGTEGFEIEAFSKVEKPVPLFGPFSIGETCLMIKMLESISFGVYTNLYIRDLRMFGAVMLKIQGSEVIPELLSAAISDITIPELLNNLLGESIDGIDCLKFIKICGLPFLDMQPFGREVLEKKKVNEIVTEFNRQVDNNNSLKLDASQVKLTSFQGRKDMDMTDLKRMRQYHINESGKIQLMAQFYYASVDTKFGSYSVQKGIFICGVISIFRKEFEVLFSFRENEGILAYAKIPKMDLGFLKIGPSKVGKENKDALPITKDSILAQFMNPEQEGLVFFLSAGKKDISFYLDGNIELFGLFGVDKRIVFCRGQVSVDLRVVWLRILQVSLHLEVNYEKFTAAKFKFCLVIDTSNLTKELVKVTQKIDAAIGKLRKKIDDANRDIDRAQAHVNELQRQINSLEGKIQDCKKAISNASWWKKAFVAIGKGAEICAYEVAKASLYTAIGVATAALNVAKGLVNLGGKVSEAVLQAVNGVIKGAMALFHLNYIKLTADASPQVQQFGAEIEFVALGKTYKVNKTIKRASLENSASDALAGVINDEMKADLDNIENLKVKKQALPNSWKIYNNRIYTLADNCDLLDEANAHIAASVGIVQSMQMAYIDEFHAPAEDFDEMNVSLMDALSCVENVLSTGVQIGNVKELEQAMGGLKQSIVKQERNGIGGEEDLEKTKELIAEYDEARMLYDKVVGNLGKIKEYQSSMKVHCENVNTKTAAGKTVVIETDRDMGRVLEQVKSQMYEYFPESWSGEHFINLSKEDKIRKYFIQAEMEEGRVPPKEMQQMRNEKLKGTYQNRL